MQTISKLFGQRVALTLVNEEYTGLIVPSATAQRMHMLGKIVAVGTESTLFKVGEFVFWQWNAMIERNYKHTIGGCPTFVLHELDMIARLKSQTVSLESYASAGPWCLVRITTEKQSAGGILLPENLDGGGGDVTFNRFWLEQNGETVKIDADIGSEVILERARANPIEIGGVRYAYVHQDSITGVLSQPNALLNA